MALRSLAIEEVMLRIKKKYDIIAQIDLDEYHNQDPQTADQWIDDQVAAIKGPYSKMDRIIVWHNEKDYYKPKTVPGHVLTELVRAITKYKIPYHVVQVLTNNSNIERELIALCGKQERIADLPHTEGKFEQVQESARLLKVAQPVVELVVEEEYEEIIEEIIEEIVTPPALAADSTQLAAPPPLHVVLQKKTSEEIIADIPVLENEETQAQRLIDEAPETTVKKTVVKTLVKKKAPVLELAPSTVQIAKSAVDYEIVATINLDEWFNLPDYDSAKSWLTNQCVKAYRDSYNINQRIDVLYNRDVYVLDNVSGLVLRNLQVALNSVDISNCFVQLITSNTNIIEELADVQKISSDQTEITVKQIAGTFIKDTAKSYPYSRQEEYQYGSANPIKINLVDLNKKHRAYLETSDTFCMYPWVHLHAWPTGQLFPCCMSEPSGQIGNAHEQTLAEAWNSQEMRTLRKNMLSNTPSEACKRCYEQESSGFFSGRQSANKHHGHHVARVDETSDDGTFARFEMTYWDIRFSNLCNLSCRSCGHIFSSSWYQDQKRLVEEQFILNYSDISDPSWPCVQTLEDFESLPNHIINECKQVFNLKIPNRNSMIEWSKDNKPLNVAGRWETDMWEQLIPHLDYVEQIYFAGGEPLLMEEHYKILDELERRGRFDVRLVYNTNFTETSLKGRSVFDYWRKFDSVSVGASLDAMGGRAEYIRKGTKWAQVEFNRKRMLTDCPNVDFYISPTLSILNAHHLPDFHKDWVNKGLIRAQDLNVNILQDPLHYRIDIADAQYKAELTEKFAQHIEWLKPQDMLHRATVGFESAIKFLEGNDKSNLLPRFWQKTSQLDNIRNENILIALPELNALKRA